MPARKFGSFFEDGLNVMNFDRDLCGRLRGLRIAPRCMKMVVVMWSALNVVMVMYWLAWAALWKTILSSVEWSGRG